MNLDCGKCRVRDWSAADKSALLRHANNRNVWLNLAHRFPHPYTESDADSWLGLLEKNPYPSHWAVEVDGAAIGGIGIDPGVGIYSKSAVFGYWLGEAYWGRGIMTAAVDVTSRYVLEHYNLVRLVSPVFEWNPASMRVLEKCGFVREGVHRKGVFKDGQVIDEVVYVLIAARS
jgi:[ribosomal protein S5]-alanine N-acetyltransferase